MIFVRHHTLLLFAIRCASARGARMQLQPVKISQGQGFLQENIFIACAALLQ